jgi:hypothetical protein
MSTAKSILDMIKQRQQGNSLNIPFKSCRNTDTTKLRQFLKNLGKDDWSYSGWLESQESLEPSLPEYEPAMSGSDWLRFSKLFVEGTNPDSGMTNQEMLVYITTSYYPNKEFDEERDWLDSD